VVYAPNIVKDQPAALFPIGAGDDQGGYLYVPLIAHWIGEEDPTVVLRWFVLALELPILAIVPLLFYLAFRSALAAVAAPWFLLVQASFMSVADVYWSVGWVLLIGIPLLWAAAQSWTRPRLYVLATLASLIAGFATSLRAQAGLPILLAALMVALTAPIHRRNRFTLVLLIGFSYAATGLVTIEVVRSYRDAVIGQPLARLYGSSHIFWHNAYIGLGYAPNDYGLAWSDSVAYDAVQQVDPGAVLGTPRYEDDVRQLYFKLLRQDPEFIIDSYLLKLAVLLRAAFDPFWPALVLIPLAITFGPRRREILRYFLLLTPAFAITLVPPLVAVPRFQYELGWLSSWSLSLTLGLCWLLASGELIFPILRTIPFGRARPGEKRSLPGAGWISVYLRRPQTVMAASVSLILSACALAAAPLADQDYYITHASPLVSSSPLNGESAVRSWSLIDGLPAEWSVLAGVRIEPTQEGLIVHTNSEKFAYQVVSPVQVLEAGSYRAGVRGAITAGGLYVGVLDTKSNTWLVTNYYWSGQRGFAAEVMAASFSLKEPANVQIILSNWSPRPQSSTWRIQSISIFQARA